MLPAPTIDYAVYKLLKNLNALLVSDGLESISASVQGNQMKLG
jgi:hypothetical protein